MAHGGPDAHICTNIAGTHAQTHAKNRALNRTSTADCSGGLAKLLVQTDRQGRQGEQRDSEPSGEVLPGPQSEKSILKYIQQWSTYNMNI